MAKALMESLQIDLPALAQIIRAKGRGRDSVLAHITPKEAALLKKRGGSGTINPDTGLPEFEDGEFGPTYAEMGYTPPVEQATAPVATPEQLQAGGYTLPPAAPVETTVQAPTFDLTSQPGYGAALQPGYVGAAPTTTAAFMQGEPGQLTPAMLGATAPEPAISPKPAAETAKTQQEKILGMSPDTLARLGLATGLGLYGTTQARKGGQQVQAATQEQKQLATPYKTQGQELVRAAQAGELTPASQQSYRAAQAQLAQQIANRGGVGAEQAANQLEALRQNLLQNQYNYGLQVSQIGDNIALGAIRTGMQLDTQLNAASNSFYTSLASIAAGIPMVRTP